MQKYQVQVAQLSTLGLPLHIAQNETARNSSTIKPDADVCEDAGYICSKKASVSGRDIK